MTRIIKEPDPPHRCHLPPTTRHTQGTIAACDECGDRWKLDYNPYAAGWPHRWRRCFFRSLFARPRRHQP